MRTVFSAENEKTFDLMHELSNGEYVLYADKNKVSKKELEDELRNRINNDILQGATLYQAFRRRNTVIFEIVEEIVNVTASEEVMDSPFIQRFVEIKNRYLGDQTNWYSEDQGLLSVASFAGNHWDTNREALDLGEEFHLPKEWIYVHVYEDIERFLLKITDLTKLTDKIYKSINKFIQERIYVQFQNIKDAVPAEFFATGNSEDALGDLVDLVLGKGGYSSITIAGTQKALRKLANIVPDKMWANSMKEAKNMNGAISTWEGNEIMVIPQTYKPGTTDRAIDDNTLFVLGGDSKPIKFEFIGDSRTEFATDVKTNNDQTIDIQVQTAVAVGLVLPAYFGVFTLQ